MYPEMHGRRERNPSILPGGRKVKLHSNLEEAKYLQGHQCNQPTKWHTDHLPLVGQSYQAQTEKRPKYTRLFLVSEFRSCFDYTLHVIREAAMLNLHRVAKNVDWEKWKYPRLPSRSPPEKWQKILQQTGVLLCTHILLFIHCCSFAGWLSSILIGIRKIMCGTGPLGHLALDCPGIKTQGKGDSVKVPSPTLLPESHTSTSKCGMVAPYQGGRACSSLHLPHFGKTLKYNNPD